MKAQRRHELHQNVLAEWLGKQLEVVKPYTTWILGGVIALCALAIVLQIITGRNAATSGTSWQQFYTAASISDPDKRLKELAQLESGPAGLSAHLSQADLKLEQATAKSYAKKEETKKLVEEAKKHYQKVVDEARRQPLLAQRAQFGLAQAFETEGEYDKAKEIYSKLIKDAPESVFGKSASRRLKRLDSTDLKTFSAQLAAHKPIDKPKSPGLQGGSNFPGFGGLGGLGGAGGMPDFGAPLPERPDLSLPGPSFDFPSLDKPDAEKDPDAGKKEADDPEKPADPEAKKPNDPDKPAADPEKKSDEGKKPAEPEKKPEGENP